MKPHASGKKIHEAVQQFFIQQGYPTEQKEGHWSGFFHGTGHGLGLELHEEPRLGKAILRPGHVFTIEPGLYIPGLGGVRHEDVITVTSSGYQLLSHFPKMLEV
jgi:Xaa-Pro aminopeptidase